MSLSSALTKGTTVLVAGLVSWATLAPCPAMAQNSESEQVSVAGLQGPPAQRRNRGQVLLLPTRGRGDSSLGRDAVDVLLTSAIEDAELELAPPSLRAMACEHGEDEFIAARAAYLDLDLEEALAAAMRAHEALLRSEASLWACPSLDNVELFIAQVYVDRQQEDAAREMMARVIRRGAVTSPDPAKYTPDFQSLWARTVQDGNLSQDPSPAPESLVKLGAAVGADWVVLGYLAGRKAEGEQLILTVVSVSQSPPKSGMLPIVLGASGGWGAAVRKGLSRFFEPREPERPAAPAARARKDTPAAQRPWYRQWWFWTAVGVVVVGGAAVAVGAAMASQDPGPTTVKVDLGQ